MRSRKISDCKKEHMKAFVQFLTDNNCKKQFVGHLMKREKKEFVHFLRHTGHERYLYNAFSWSSTVEGHGYWHKLHNEWIKLCAAQEIEAKRKYIDAFMQFIKNEGVEESFLEQYKKYRKEDIEAYLASTTPKSYFANSFEWIGSKEGRPFWEALSDKWEMLCQDLEKSVKKSE